MIVKTYYIFSLLLIDLNECINYEFTKYSMALFGNRHVQGSCIACG